MSLSAIPRKLRDSVWARDKGRCGYCSLRQFGQSATFHINHVIPRSKGGSTDIENLVLQCPHCSMHKSNTTESIDLTTGEMSPLFHPLKQAWEDHFTCTADGTLHGKTPAARATLATLRMNDPLPLVARALQLANGIL